MVVGLKKGCFWADHYFLEIYKFLLEHSSRPTSRCFCSKTKEFVETPINPPVIEQAVTCSFTNQNRRQS